MNLTLSGHAYKYAVEQIMLMMYPGELPVYPAELPDAQRKPGGLSAEVTLTLGTRYATARTRITAADGSAYTGTSRVPRGSLSDRLTSDRLLQKIIKRSFYKAAVLQTGEKPVWGALTGIRPGKIALNLLESGRRPGETAKELEQEYFVSPVRTALCLDTARAGLRVKSALRPGDIALYVGSPLSDPGHYAACQPQLGKVHEAHTPVSGA
jgi:oxygen-independent coproporphyrinogen-3 oxidase